MSETDELDAAIAELWERWRGEMMRRVDVVAAAVDALVAGQLNDEARAEATLAAHNMAGTAGSFGFEAASMEARAIEKAFENGAGASEAPALAERIKAIRADFESRGV